MKLPRRNFLHLASGAAALPALSRIARSQAYPSRPVRVIVPFAPTGDADLVAPLMGQWLSERLGQPFIIENRPGAGSNIATEAVVRAPADGYMLLLVSTANAVNATLYEKLNFNFLRDVAPVATIYYVPNVMAVHPSFPAKTIPRTGRRRCADVRQFRYAQASKPPRYLMRILPDSLERPAHALFSRVSCPKEEIMKRTLIAGFSVLAMIVGVEAANAQANINRNVYPNNASERYGAQAPWEWYASVGPVRRGNQCVVDVDINRGYGFMKDCPAPQASAAPRRPAASRTAHRYHRKNSS